ncbi:hypothetical protein KFE25_005346 [Diacronema lutheri]|uniref:RecF/RecN/SMC N-terminal domain-containing protein n=1 Tax=Diacronema lutheri TaxID=2081491 RepID=A0A8J5XBT5_DIALT|nr:hypothetical protein KFE25_005346 [Diacronema lutheri]
MAGSVDPTRALRAVRVTSVTLEGFKGFRRTHTVGPFSGFSVIAGANGQGKSTAVEGICWVLGGDASLASASAGGGDTHAHSASRSAYPAAAALIAHGERRAEVTVHLSVGGERLSIRRSVTDGASDGVRASAGAGTSRHGARSAKPIVELRVQRTGVDGWHALTAPELSALLRSIGLHAPCAAGTRGPAAGGGGTTTVQREGLPFYLSQGNSVQLLKLPAPELFARAEWMLCPQHVSAVEACAAEAELARLAAAAAESRVKAQRAELDGAQPLLAQARAMLRSRCDILSRKLRVLRDARELHAAWLRDLGPAVRAALASEGGARAAEALHAEGSVDAERALTAARSAQRTLERTCAESSARARRAAATCAEAQRAASLAEHAAAVRAEEMAREAKRAAERDELLTSLGAALEAARAARAAAQGRASALERQLRARLDRLGVARPLALAYDREQSGTSPLNGECAALDQLAADGADVQAQVDELDRKLWAALRAAAARGDDDERSEGEGESEVEGEAEENSGRAVGRASSSADGQALREPPHASSVAPAAALARAKAGTSLLDSCAEVAAATARAAAAASGAAQARASADAARSAASDAASRVPAERARVRAAADVLHEAARERARTALAVAAEASAPAADGAREQLVCALVRAPLREGDPHVHGTFKQIAWLADERAGRAVTAALAGGLRDGIIVETRAHAEAVCARFKQERVGAVWGVLRAEAATAAQTPRGAAPRGSTWLVDAIGCAPAMRGAVELLAAGWLLCEDAVDAERLSRPPRASAAHAQQPVTAQQPSLPSQHQRPGERGPRPLARSYDCVTLDGRVFLRRGEIRSAGGSRSPPSGAGGTAAVRAPIEPYALMRHADFVAAQPLVARSHERPVDDARGAHAHAHQLPRQASATDAAADAASAAERAAHDALLAAQAAADCAAANAAAAASRAEALDKAAAAMAERARAAATVEAAARSLAAANAEAAAARERSRPARTLAAPSSAPPAAGVPCARTRARGTEAREAAAAELRARLRSLEPLLRPAARWRCASDLADDLERARAAAREAESSLAQLGHKRKRALATAHAGGVGAAALAHPLHESNALEPPRRVAQRVRDGGEGVAADGEGGVTLAARAGSVAPPRDGPAAGTSLDVTHARDALELATKERANAAKVRREDAAALRGATRCSADAEARAAEARRELASARRKAMSASEAARALEAQESAVRAVAAELDGDARELAQLVAAALATAEAADARPLAADMRTNDDGIDGARDQSADGEVSDDGGESQLRHGAARGATRAKQASAARAARVVHADDGALGATLPQPSAAGAEGAQAAEEREAEASAAAGLPRRACSKALLRCAAQSARMHDEASALDAELSALEQRARALSADPTLAALPTAVDALRVARVERRATHARARALSAELVEREADRQAAFDAALAAANARLSRLFAQLSPGADATLELSATESDGAAGCGATASAEGELAPAGAGGVAVGAALGRLAAPASGAPIARGARGALRAIARTRGQPWREFAALSGGQQQLLAISAHLALGESAQPPLPLLLLDEIDSALDSRNVLRVVDVLRARRGRTQAICVSRLRTAGS